MKFEYENPLQPNVLYLQQLNQIEPELAKYAALADPKATNKKDAQDIWDKLNQPVSVSTANLRNNAIHDLEAIPFRTALEELGMPFADDVIYTADDITSANTDDELLANTLANIYQLGNLNNIHLIQIPYLNKLDKLKFDNFSDEIQTFVKDLIISNKPFEYVSFSMPDEAQAFIQAVFETNPNASMTPIVLHPDTKNISYLFSLTDNIDGMSPKQITNELKNLNKINGIVNRADIKSIITSPQVDRNAQSSSSMNRSSNETSRGQRIKQFKPRKLNNVKKITTIISRTIKKQTSSLKTNNVTKITHKTYNKPNRREPENDFKPGKSMRKVYRPDIHLYLDTSGSISIDQYKTGIEAAIRIAKELKTNIYISSFSHILADPILLDNVSKLSTKRLIKKALSLPVVSGGTDFENVYNDIQTQYTTDVQHGHLPQFNIICSDMEFSFTSGYQVPAAAKSTLHLLTGTNDYFATDAFNAGLTHIDKLLYRI